jgi:Flp pilus assembly protein TadD
VRWRSTVDDEAGAGQRRGRRGSRAVGVEIMRPCRAAAQRQDRISVQAGRQLRHAAGVALDLEARRGVDLPDDGSKRRRVAMAAKFDRHHAASGRSYMLLSAAYHGLGQPAEAKTAMEKALALRPGSTVSNVALPRKNSSPALVAAIERIERTLVAEGLPER